MNDRRDFIKTLLASAVSIPIGMETLDFTEENNITKTNDSWFGLEPEKIAKLVENGYNNDPHWMFQHIREVCELIEPNIDAINKQITKQSLLSVLTPLTSNDEINDDEFTKIGVYPQIRLSEAHPLLARASYLKKRIETKSSAALLKIENAEFFRTLDDFTKDDLELLTNDWQNLIIHICLHSRQMPHALVVNKEMLSKMQKESSLFCPIDKKEVEKEHHLKNGFVGRYYTPIDEINEIDGLKVYADLFEHNYGEPRAYLLPEPKLAGTFINDKYKCLNSPNERELRTGHIIYKDRFEINLNPDAEIYRII